MIWLSPVLCAINKTNRDIFIANRTTKIKINHIELSRIGICFYPETFDMVGFTFSLMFSILLLASEIRFKYGRRENADNDIFLNLGFDSILISSR